LSDLNTVPVPNDGFCVRELGGETIFLAAKGDVIHSLDEVGSFIWKAVDGRNSLEVILKKITEEYEIDHATAKADLLAFVRELAAKNLLKLDVPS